jgi:cell fate (sporulation/competence/biofilm development) regulator YlbF (YheA/YmcA/DUF963 family)
MLETNDMKLKTTTDQELQASIRDFVNALVDSPQYRAFEQTNTAFQQDIAAKDALQEYQAKAHDLQTKQMFNLTSEEEKEELQRLWMKFLSFQSVKDYMHAQDNLQAISRECAKIISDHCGLDYATASGASCCG